MPFGPNTIDMVNMGVYQVHSEKLAHYNFGKSVHQDYDLAMSVLICPLIIQPS